MKKVFFFLLFLTIINLTFSRNNSEDIEFKTFQAKIEKLESENHTIQNNYNSLTIQYQQTNDRLNNYLTFTGIVSSIFGVLIALAGIYIGFESLKSQSRKEEAIKTLEEAKTYVNKKKSVFDNLIKAKKKLLQEEYDKISQLLKEKLLNDIEIETSKIREISEKKTEEIQSFSVEQENNKTIELLEKRLDFFENIGIPDDPEILFSKAKILREKKMHNEAILLLEKLIEKLPQHKNAYWHLGFEYASIKNNDKSIENYNKHLGIIPEDHSALNNIALRYKDKNNLLKALECLNKAIEHSNKTELYYTNRIDILKKLNSNDKVIENYIVLLSINPNKIEYYNQLIASLKKEDRNEDILTYYNIAINHFKENNFEISNSLNFSKALYLGENNKEQEAIEILQNLIDNNYKVENCYINIAELKHKIGKTTEAIKILDNAISNNPLSSALYIYKAFIESSIDEQNSKLTIDIGGKSINTENFYFLAGQFFNQKLKLTLANYCYEGVLKIIKPKLKKEEIKESDLMNYYESSIILQKSLEEFNGKYRRLIITEKYLIIMSVLDILNKLYKNYNDREKIKALEQIKNLNIEAKDKDLIIWDFEDISKFIETKKEDEFTTFTQNLIKYIQQKIKFEEL